MTRISRSLILSAGMLAALTGVGSASTFPDYLGSLSGVSGNNNLSFKATNVTGSFVNAYSFTLINPTASAFMISISATDGFANSSQIFNPLTLDLYSGLSTAGLDTPGTPLQEAKVTTVGTTIGAQFTFLNDVVAPGGYSFTISGDVPGTNSYGGALSVSVSPVPLPSSAPLMGMALLAAGAVGFVRARKQAAKAI